MPYRKNHKLQELMGNFDHIYRKIDLYRRSSNSLNLKDLKKDLELLKKTGHLELRTTISGDTPLLFAVKSGNRYAIDMLLRLGANIFAKNNFRQNILHLLTMSKLDFVFKQKYFEFFIKKGLDVNDKDIYGRTPLHYAVDLGEYNLTKYLLSKGADINAKDVFKETPLHYAIQYKKLAVLELLLRNGADLYAKDYRKRTIFDKLEKIYPKDLQFKIEEILKKYK